MPERQVPPRRTLGSAQLFLACWSCAAHGAAGEEEPDFPAPVEIDGTVRLRHETSHVEGAPDRDRQRLRLRLGATYRVDPSLTLGARLTTGDPDDPNSPHATLGDGFDGLELSLDRAYVDWRPDDASRVMAGKFGHPNARNPVYGELVWDADVQPEGAAIERALGEAFDLVLGGYSVLETAATAGDAHLVVAQLIGRADLASELAGTLALGYYGYDDDLAPPGTDGLPAESPGNATEDSDGDGVPDRFVSRFGLVDVIASAVWSGGERPVTLAFQTVDNTRARVPGDRARAIGAALGSIASPGDWQAYYQWQAVEQDAVLAAFAQDDFLRATDHESHVLGVRVRTSNAVSWHVWGLVSRPEAGPADDDWRLRIDLNLRF